MFSDLPPYYLDLVELPSRATPTGRGLLLWQAILPGRSIAPPHVEALFRMSIFH